MTDPTGRNAKLVCRRLWKLYGAEPLRRLRERGIDLAAADPADSRRVATELGLIVAAGNVSFEVEPGECFIVMGLSGSGKSTVIRCLSRLVEPTAGEVELDGKSLLAMSERELIAVRRRRMGMVFQHFGLFGHQTVLENVAFPLKVQGIGRPEREKRARETIELVGLKGREESYPWQLSGGQQQRVGFARSLAVGPDLWLLDEPFSALDPLIRRQMQTEFLNLKRMLGKTVVFITHDFLEAVYLADRVAIMREGEIVQIGTPAELMLRPATDYVRQFTRDVPRPMVLTAGDIAEPLGGNGEIAAGAPEVRAGTRLAEILAQVSIHAPTLTVVDPAGRPVGRLTPQSLSRALGSAERPA
ncbi:ABC transporter ATP-binding protein [Hypericibacter adhaerens]|jgi:glycine betaine/proline transport system ATP-binding protein|uniref:ABC transporter ATP-binding protein n=1 Tax=Hypericibacter adhaerens TaxID=2602016 RepID=A0A5J6MV33_9PROT|nr:ATP-binding cassette domain-containing protein [Hypericibacter adhaerens]QEX21047.1 ABC transporter ATP-binding protein [Hypericibacter adhaerens]